MKPSFKILCNDCKNPFEPKTMAEQYCKGCKRKRKQKANEEYKKKQQGGLMAGWFH